MWAIVSIPHRIIHFGLQGRFENAAITNQEALRGRHHRAAGRAAHQAAQDARADVADWKALIRLIEGSDQSIDQKIKRLLTEQDVRKRYDWWIDQSAKDSASQRERESI